MIGTPKPTASLSSNLLARKGQARPAMRPQGFVGLSPATAHDDLGWNDMGEDAPRPAPIQVHQPQHHQPAPKPMVLRQREELDQQIAEPRFEPEPVSEPAGEQKSPLAVRQPKAEAKPVAEAPAAAPARAKPVAKAAVARAARTAVDKKGKAAFTLRLDHDRHLRLRLASALTNRSAQLLVTEALDAFLDTLTDVDALARQVAKDHG